jgi:L-ascorbate metabolism protein UlaG (beta-lactamase superfamily)
LNNRIKEALSTKASEFFASTEDGLFYLSHASILVRLNGKRFLFDPVLAKPPHLGSWLFYPEMVIDRRMLEVDAVFVSHQHRDHFDEEFLALLPPTTPVYIVEGRPQLLGQMQAAKLNVVELPSNQPFDLGGGVNCFGVLHEYNGIDSAIAISNGSFTVYHGNDCFLSNDRLSLVKEQYANIDVACIPFAYVHWYPFLLEEVDPDWKKQEANRLIKDYLDFGLRQTTFLAPQVAIPFGANMFYCDDIDSDHNKAVLSPFDFKHYALEVGSADFDRIFTLFAGDSVLSLKDQKGLKLSINQSSLTRDQLHKGFSSFLSEVRRIGTGFDSSELLQLSRDQLSDLSFMKDRLGCIQDSMQETIYLSNSDNPDDQIVAIDLDQLSVTPVTHVDSRVPYHHFRLTDLAYRAYFSKRFSLNEVIASSRFTLVRRPNTYRIEALRIVNNVL